MAATPCRTYARLRLHPWGPLSVTGEARMARLDHCYDVVGTRCLELATQPREVHCNTSSPHGKAGDVRSPCRLLAAWSSWWCLFIIA